VSRIKVESVEEAVRVAEQLKCSDRSYWFRGQTKDWPVRSTLARVASEDRNRMLEKLARYEGWVRSTRGLEDLASNVDAAIAVAQHYGIPTNFVDFTTEPKIAAFFASEHAGPDTASDLACIVYLDIQDLKEFWQPLAGRYPPPEFLRMEVPDLWRLEAQHGCFLFCPYDEIERIYDFDRILFPNAHVFRHIRREDVYPDRKSHLEILLDQYFMNERMIEGERDWNPEGVTRVLIDGPKEGCDPDVFPNGLPEHASWSDAALRPWLDLRGERFDNAHTAIDFRLHVQYPRNATHVARAVADQLLRDLLTLPGIRSKLVGWGVEVMTNHGLPQDFACRLAPKLARLWDGLRRLPYNDEDLCAGLGMCVAFAIALRGDFRNPDSRHWERAAEECLVNPIELEFGTTDGSYSRGYASAANLAAAFRPDILSHVSDRWQDQMATNPRWILQSAWNPKKSFDFQALTLLFARELAPYQVLARDSAVFYSPARLDTLGLP